MVAQLLNLCPLCRKDQELRCSKALVQLRLMELREDFVMPSSMDNSAP
jgi:hypothetical protein